MKTKNKNRIWSFILSAMLSIEQIAFAMPSISKAAGSVDFASNKGMTMFPNSGNNSAQLFHDDSLVDNGDGTFTFTSKITSAYSYSDYSESRLKSKDGEYILDKAGKYLIEVWGGDGGDGSRSFLTGRNGVGGKGGFVYGILEVSEEKGNLGKKLVYEIGSKGESSTFQLDGGGTGGVGGGAGQITFISIGAGGGYSAVYLLNSNEELDPADPKPNLRDDSEKVLMIAGGGGGGAAGGNGIHFYELFLKAKGDGGDGGSNKSAIQATPNIGDFTTGKYYSGADGTSAGGNTKYVGHGGTDKPGEATRDALNIIKGENPNDWQRLYIEDGDRGAGSAGNLRGAGGGAGFAGGSGGLQNAMLDANNVGGGGGGSSYTAPVSEAFTPYAVLTDNQKPYFVESDGNTYADVGGAVVIRYLPDDADYSYLNNVKISGTVSDDFDIVSATCTDKGGGDITVNKSGTDNRDIDFTGSVKPVETGISKGQADDSMTLKLVLKPTIGFMGGNKVPIFADDGEFTCKTMVDRFYENNDINSTTDKQRSFAYAENVRYVNIPFKYEAGAQSGTFNLREDYATNPIYGSNNIIVSKTNTANAFVKENGIHEQYVVEAGTDTMVRETDYTLAKYNSKGLHKFDVVLEVEPTEDGTGYVGTANDYPTTYIKARSVIEIVDGEPLDGFTVKASKSLDYTSSDDTYDFTVDFDIASQNELNKSFYVYDPIASNGTDYPYRTATYSVPLTEGYYYIEAYGGDGGRGGNAFLSGLVKHYGGQGGKGGHVEAFLEVSKGETKTLYVTIGKVGDQGADSKLTSWTSEDGKGGLPTKIRIGSNDILIAGGGGGGGAAYRSGLSGYSGEDGYDAGYSGSGVKSSTDTNPNQGEDGHGNSSTPTQKAKGGLNAKDDSALINESDIPNYIDKTYTALSEPTDNGAVRITKLGVKGGYGNIDGTETSTTATAAEVSAWQTEHTAYYDTLKSYVKNFTLTEVFSDYFDIDSIEITGVKEDNEVPTPTISKIGQTVSSVFGLEDTAVKGATPVKDTAYTPITGYNSITTEKRTYSYSVDGSCSITVKLKRKSNLVGGNDIPLLNVLKVDQIAGYDASNEPDYMDVTSGTEVSLSHDGAYTGTPDDPNTIYLKRNDATDWANVAINGDLLEVTAPNDPIIIDCGDETPDLSSAVTFAGKNDNTNIYTFVDTESDTAPSGAVTEDCKLTVIGTIKPKAATKAVKIPSVEAVSKHAEADIKVMYSVTKELTYIEQQGSVQYISSTDGAANNIVSDEKEAILNTGDSNNIDKLTLSKIEDAYVLNLKADGSYELPEASEVTVKYSDGKDVDANVTKSKGVITVMIPRSSFTNNITVTAVGVAKKEYHVHYYYEYYDPETPNMIQTAHFEDPTVYYVSDNVTNLTDGLTPKDYPPWGGYANYYWEWSDEVENSGTHTIVDGDIYVIGKFVKRNIPLTITYQYENGDTATPTYSAPKSGYNTTVYMDGKYYWYAVPGETYMVPSPEINGYYPDQAEVVFDIPDVVDEDTYQNGITKTVHYFAINSTDNVIVNLIQCDAFGIPVDGSNTTVQSYPVTEGIDFDKTSEISSWVDALGDDDEYEIINMTRLVDDEEVDVESISGKLASGEKAVFYVRYRPKPPTVTVQFNAVDRINVADENRPDEADVTIGMLSRNVVPEREYGYDPDKNQYVGLPTPECRSSGADWISSGWRFVGWYDENDNPVDETTIVPSGINPIKLYAHWQPLQVTITIDYRYAYNVNDEDLQGEQVPSASLGIDAYPKTLVKAYGMVYKVESPSLTGYTPDPEFVEGEARESKTETVYYKDGNPATATTEKKLRVEVYSSSSEESNGEPKTGAKKLIGGTFRLYDESGNPIGEAQYNEDGSVSWSSIKVKLVEGDSYTVTCIDPPSGYGCKSIPVVFTPDPDSNEDVRYIFLDKSPFQLPMAGSKPMTGYTVFGISAMLLAGLLMFAYVNSRTEENNEKE